MREKERQRKGGTPPRRDFRPLIDQGILGFYADKYLSKSFPV